MFLPRWRPLLMIFRNWLPQRSPSEPSVLSLSQIACPSGSGTGARSQVGSQSIAQKGVITHNPFQIGNRAENGEAEDVCCVSLHRCSGLQRFVTTFGCRVWRDFLASPPPCHSERREESTLFRHATQILRCALDDGLPARPHQENLPCGCCPVRCRGSLVLFCGDCTRWRRAARPADFLSERVNPC